MVHFYIRSVINLFLLLFLSGIFTASAFGGDEKNSTNALEVYEPVHVEVESSIIPQDDNIAPLPSASNPIVISATGGVEANFFSAAYNDKKNESTSGEKCFDLSRASYLPFASYSLRMASFKTWDPEHPKKPENLVENGFFYAGYSDCARCFYCGLGLKYWRPSADIVYQHAVHRPSCQYLRMREGDEFVDKVEREKKNSQNASVATSSQQSLPSNNTGDDEPCSSESLGIITKKTKHPEYVLENVRDQSFEKWPNDHPKPHDLVQAGFFYTGYNDRARCFHCGGGLRDWEEGDDVQVEHARWFPKCAFLHQKMGQPFIDAVQELVQKLGKNHGIISYEQVMDTMRKNGDQVPHRPGKDREPLDIYQKILIDQYFREVDVREATQRVKDKGKAETLDAIYDELVKMKTKKITQFGTSDKNINCSVSKKNETQEQKQKILEYLKEKNDELKQRTLCEKCLEKKVDIVFLPCGHFSCLDCSYYLETCPVCQDEIKAIVKAEIPD